MTIPTYMIIPTYVIIPTAMIAMMLFMSTYYKVNPDNRVINRPFLLAFSCMLVNLAQIFVLVQRYDRRIPSMVLFALAVALLVVGVRTFKFGRPPPPPPEQKA